MSVDTTVFTCKNGIVFIHTKGVVRYNYGGCEYVFEAPKWYKT